MTDGEPLDDRPSTDEGTPTAAAGGLPGDDARQLFKYVTVDEWRDYRAIMAVFAGTFFAEFGPDEVVTQLAGDGYTIDPVVAANRLESLRNWGNLTVSTSVGSPTSLADYYRRRNRYLITRAGQEVHEVVEGVLTRVDEVRDVSTSRLRALHDALRALHSLDADHTDAIHLADAVQAVFDPHEAFTSEITQFFAAINQWQSRYDLSVDEFTFFAEVLVGYVAERLDEIERTSRPIGRLLEDLAPTVPVIVRRARSGLASRVESAGLGDAVTVSRMAGSTVDDWRHLTDWFATRAGTPSRIERLTGDAVSAIRTLTLNLTRLSRIGVGASSRRADFLRLARFFDGAAPGEEPRLAVAALGLHPSNHWGVVADDTDDPASSTTPWAVAARASVPVSLRERGNTANRGRATPMRDRSVERRALVRRREQELDAQRRVDTELVSAPEIDGRELSSAALTRLQQAIARTVQRLAVGATRQSAVDGHLTDDATGRRTLVTVLRWMIDRGLATELHSHIDQYANDDTADAVLKLRPDRIALIPLPALVDAAGAVELLARTERRSATRQWIRGRLVEDPVVYRDDLTDDEWGEFRRRLGEEERLLDERLGLVLEARAEGVAAIDPTGTLADRRFPTGGTVGHAALLLIDRLGSDDAADIPIASVVDLMAELCAVHRARWSNDYVDAPELLARRAIDLLVEIRLAMRTTVSGDTDGSVDADDSVEAVRLLPAAVRFAPVEPEPSEPQDQQDALW